MTAITIELDDMTVKRIQSDPEGMKKAKALLHRGFAQEPEKRESEKWEYEVSSEVPVMSEQERIKVLTAIEEADVEEGEDLTHEEVFAQARTNFLNRKKVA
jgi:predicted transcriptional regulator